MHIYNSTRQIGVLAVAGEGPSPTIGSHITIGLNKIAGLAWVDPVHPVAGGASGLEDLGAVLRALAGGVTPPISETSGFASWGAGQRRTSCCR